MAGKPNEEYWISKGIKVDKALQNIGMFVGLCDESPRPQDQLSRGHTSLSNVNVARKVEPFHTQETYAGYIQAPAIKLSGGGKSTYTEPCQMMKELKASKVIPSGVLPPEDENKKLREQNEVRGDQIIRLEEELSKARALLSIEKRKSKNSGRQVIRLSLEKREMEEKMRDKDEKSEIDMMMMMMKMEEKLRDKDRQSENDMMVMKKMEEKIRVTEQDLEKAVRQLTCIICQDNEREIVCVPCGHIAMCGECFCNLPNGEECPCCRQDMQGIGRVYFP